MKCMVIDGNSIINRAYYGIRPLTNREGLYTHAVFGFLTTLLRLKEEERPDALCVTFDLHAPTFRHKADEAYKATRKPMPEELRMQVPVLKEVLDTLNIPRYEMEGWEADDLIGTISRKCEAAGWDCVVVTGDKDSLQLITDHTKVKLVSTRMGQTTTKDMTPETFREQYGFEPIHMIDLKALMGDTSDNIPGVPGVGEKTAMDLIQKYGSVDAIYEKLPDIDAKPAAIKKLTAGENAARHSYWLATIVTDAPLSFDPAENRVQEPTPAAYPLFLKLEFSKLIEKMGLRPEETAPADAAPDVTVTAERITEESRAREVLELFRKADHVTVLALPDLSGVIADCDTGADTALSAEFFFKRYTGDWNALLNALCLPEGEALGIEQMPLEQAKTVLAGEFEKGYQGILIGVHTLAAMKLLNVHLAVMHAQLDYAIERTSDIRGFNALVMTPDWANIAFSPRLIVAMDGFLSDGERALAKRQFPEARIIEVTNMRTQSAACAGRLLPSDDALRQLYKALRQRERTDCTLNVLSAAIGLDESTIRCGMRIMEQLGLVEYTLQPFRFQLIPSGKVSLESSMLRAKLLQMKDEGGKPF